MVDVGGKLSTHRTAVAEAVVRMKPSTVRRLRRADLDKGDALAVARVAGISASKKVADLIPLAHPLSLSHVALNFDLDARAGMVRIEASVECYGPTGVEMEAMTSASVAALNLYDMIKKTERGATIECVRLLAKTGGTSGDYRRSGSAAS
ncbi:MAG: cyclic pyranopterin monophosphate synthase MoaC [Deltaproteobacteria bacterium]|nr:cyclic pyranopterin monophosphate synthase MoaC [Deltaproteobacteria bacterium]